MRDCPFLRDAWRRAAGLPEVVDLPVPTLAALKTSEWSAEFEQAMRNRLIMGALRHGPIGAPGKPRYDRVESMTRRLALYAADGNREHLVDVSNLALLEFVEGTHPNGHWAPTDDGEHTKVVE